MRVDLICRREQTLHPADNLDSPVRLVSEISEAASRSAPPVASPIARPAMTCRLSVHLCWIVFAQVFLKISKPPGEISTELSFGQKPEAWPGVYASPLTIDGLPHVPACTGSDEAAH